MARPATVMASTSENGSPSITTRSLKVPGSDSSALHTRWWGRPSWSATPRHFTPVGKAAPPRPDRPEAVTSAMTWSDPIASAASRAW